MRVRFAIFLVFMLATIAMNASAQIVTDGLVSYWTFDKDDVGGGIVEDVWGDNNGAIKGDPKTVEGRVGEAMKFDGVDDYVEVPDSDSLKPDQYTIEAWVNIPSAQAAWHGTWVLAKEHSYLGYGIAIGGQEPGIYHSDAVIWHRVDSNVDISLNEWHHIAGTYDGEIVIAYVDGSLMNSVEYEFVNGTRNLLFGSWYGSRFYNGLICEARVYNRALDDDEIARNAKAERLAVTNHDKLALTWGEIKVSR